MSGGYVTKRILLTLALVAGGFFAGRYSLWDLYSVGYDEGLAYERALTEECRRTEGNDYDKMVYCIEGFYGTDEAEELTKRELPSYGRHHGWY